MKAGAPWDPKENKTVLITSGQGGTGHVGVQLAKALGAGYIISVVKPYEQIIQSPHKLYIQIQSYIYVYIYI